MFKRTEQCEMRVRYLALPVKLSLSVTAIEIHKTNKKQNNVQGKSYLSLSLCRRLPARRPSQYNKCSRSEAMSMERRSFPELRSTLKTSISHDHRKWYRWSRTPWRFMSSTLKQGFREQRKPEGLGLRVASAHLGFCRLDAVERADRDLGFCFVVILHEVSDMIDDHQWIVRDRHFEMIEHNQALASRNEFEKDVKFYNFFEFFGSSSML